MAMQQLNLITQENASSSDELTQSAEQLSELADRLTEAVSFFNIGAEEEISNKENEEEDKVIDKKTEEKSRESQKASFSSERSDIINLDKDFDNYEKF